MDAMNTVNATASVNCVQCGEGHLYDMCPYNPQSFCYVQNNPYSKTYIRVGKTILTLDGEETNHRRRVLDNNRREIIIPCTTKVFKGIKRKEIS